MKREELMKKTSDLKTALDAPLADSELANGWTLKSQRATLALLDQIMQAIRTGTRLPHLSIGRGLDHWGVEGGPLFERACEISNGLHDLED